MFSMIPGFIERIKKIPVDIAEKDRIEELARETEAQEARLVRERARFEEVKADAATALETISREKSLGFPWLATAYSEYHKLYDLKLADELEYKRPPARRAAEVLREVAAEKAGLRRENRILRSLHSYYVDCFPWLSDFIGEDLDDLIRQAYELGGAKEPEDGEQEDEDPAGKWLTEAEQTSQQLTRTEKFQRALDRYWQSKKAPWQIGLDYERYVGYQYERKGYKVQYFGAERGLEDLGRDLICTKGRDVKIIQCKHWGTGRTLHEKHVCQIFGTAAAFRRLPGEQMDLLGSPRVVPWLYLSCDASPTAKEFAKLLGVKIVENYPLSRYPIIKCNVSQRNGDKIYHLPFDQQYDRTLIEHMNECYAETVAEAEALGFRRAFRWRGQGRD